MEVRLDRDEGLATCVFSDAFFFSCLSFAMCASIPKMKFQRKVRFEKQKVHEKCPLPTATLVSLQVSCASRVKLLSSNASGKIIRKRTVDLQSVRRAWKSACLRSISPAIALQNRKVVSLNRRRQGSKERVSCMLHCLCASPVQWAMDPSLDSSTSIGSRRLCSRHKDHGIFLCSR